MAASSLPALIALTATMYESVPAGGTSVVDAGTTGGRAGVDWQPATAATDNAIEARARRALGDIRSPAHAAGVGYSASRPAPVRPSNDGDDARPDRPAR